MNRFLLFFIMLLGLVMVKPVNMLAQLTDADSIDNKVIQQQKQEQFYDSLKYKASQGKFTQLIYDFLISPPRPYVDKKELALNYYSQLDGKIISEIKIKSLDVFGPTFQDTSRTASSKLEKAANKIHTKSNLPSIEKLLLFKVGDVVDAEVIYENERLIRSLPYIKEINILLEQDSAYSGFVKVLILIKDRFSFGVSGNVHGIQSAAFEIYNNNIFGVGHEIAFVFAGHVNKQPYLGAETYYKIKNIHGKFVDIFFGYLNTFKSEGFQFNLNKPFITTSIKWGYGATAMRMFRANYIFQNDVVYSESAMDFLYYSAWGGHSFNVKKYLRENAQIVLTAGFNRQEFNVRPVYDAENINYFADRTFLLSGITFTQRRFIQDELVYSYGITEDIPEGFKNEIVYGYDFNEFGNRHYAHLLLSNGNLLINKKGYLYTEADIGGYYGARGFEQGQIDARVHFISKLLNTKQKGARIFINTDYTIGLHRLDIESLNLSRDNSVRGFSSRQAFGKQRLSFNLEYVLFLQKEFYKFNMALFGFTDIGIIGSNKEFILTQDFYSGLGMGIRLHNENLVFKTIQLRLAFYPFHPNNMSLVGFVLEEQSKGQFYSFEPTQPQPLRFE